MTASCCSSQLTLAGLPPAEFSALDVIALKLHCLDARFLEPLRQIGRVFGERIAAESSRVSAEQALSSMLSSCGFPTALQTEFLELTKDHARLRVTGCGELCGPIPVIGRQVCGFNTGVFEGFLRGATGEAWSIEETACLGLGHLSCEFSIERGTARVHHGGNHAER